MSTKNKKPSTAKLRKLEIQKWLLKLRKFENSVKYQIRQAAKRPPETTSFTLLAGVSDKSGEYIQIFHGGGPPGPGSKILGNFSIPINR